MGKQKALSIVAFVGLPGSGKTAAAAHLATQGAPHIRGDETEKIIEKIERVAEAGQRLIVLDDLASWQQCLAIKHAFPGRLSVVALVAGAKVRHHRLENRAINTVTPQEAEARDREILQASEKAEPIAAADYTIINEGSLEALAADIDKIVAEIRTCRSDISC